MKKNIIFTIIVGLLFSSIAQAQFFVGCTRQKVYKESVKRSAANAQEQELPWVQLVRTEEKKVNCYGSSYASKTPTFSQAPVAKEKAVLFTKRTNLLQRAINGNGILLGYELVVPVPTDLTSVAQWEAEHLATAFKQGLKYKTAHGDYIFEAKKYQDGMVEMRFQPKTSLHTFILLVDCRHRKIYLFLDNYKNK